MDQLWILQYQNAILFLRSYWITNKCFMDWLNACSDQWPAAYFCLLFCRLSLCISLSLTSAFSSMLVHQLQHCKIAAWLFVTVYQPNAHSEENNANQFSLATWTSYKPWLNRQISPEFYGTVSYRWFHGFLINPYVGSGISSCVLKTCIVYFAF